MEKKNKTLTEILLEEFRNNNNLKTRELGLVFYNLFSIAKLAIDLEDSLLFVYECWNGEIGGKDVEWYKENWFYSFHKSLRQCDFFQHCNITLKANKLTEEEDKHRRKLLAEEIKGKKDFGLYDVEFGSFEYYEKNKRFKEQGWYKDLRQELTPLDDKFFQEKDYSLNGYLDGMLYNLIHADTNNVLHTSMECAFEEYKIYNPKELNLDL